MRWHHIPAADKPVHSRINQERRARHTFTNSLPLDMLLLSSKHLPTLEDIPEEDIPAEEDVLKPEEAIPPLIGQIPGSLALDGHISLYSNLLNGHYVPLLALLL